MFVSSGKPTSPGLKDCVMTVQLKFEELEEPDRAEDSVKRYVQDFPIHGPT
jgi:hypothetical protein